MLVILYQWFFVYMELLVLIKIFLFSDRDLLNIQFELSVPTFQVCTISFPPFPMEFSTSKCLLLFSAFLKINILFYLFFSSNDFSLLVDQNTKIWSFWPGKSFLHIRLSQSPWIDPCWYVNRSFLINLSFSNYSWLRVSINIESFDLPQSLWSSKDSSNEISSSW